METLKTFGKDVHGLALEAHIIELYYTAISTFMSQFQKPYFVDPIFYKFDENFFEEFKEKRWAKSMISSYGLESIIEAHPSGFDYSCLHQAENLREIVGKVLEYQRTRLPLLSGSANELALLSGEDVADIAPPEFLIAPYVVATDQESLKLNRLLGQLSNDLRKPGERLFLVLAINKELLIYEYDKLKSAIDEMKKLAHDGFLIWVCDFKENNEDSNVLLRFEEICSRLRGTKSDTVMNLFGGYYSTLLCAKSLISGNVQGIGGISEFRDPFVSGGGGRKRYYVRIAHQSVGVDLADDLVEISQVLFKCQCEYCKAQNLPSNLSVHSLACHAMSARIEEFRGAAVPTSQLMDHLSCNARVLEALKEDKGPLQSLVADVVDRFSNRLQVWERCLQDLKSKGKIQ